VMGLRTAIAGPLGSPMHTISKKLAKQEKRARFPTSEREKYFGVASGSGHMASTYHNACLTIWKLMQ